MTLYYVVPSPHPAAGWSYSIVGQEFDPAGVDDTKCADSGYFLRQKFCCKAGGTLHDGTAAGGAAVRGGLRRAAIKGDFSCFANRQTFENPAVSFFAYKKAAALSGCLQ